MKHLNKYILGALVVVLAVSGCKKSYFEVNNDPNRPNDSTTSAALIYNNAAVTIGARLSGTEIAFINRWIGYWSTSGDFAVDQTETSYNIDHSFSDVPWQRQYDVLFDLFKVKQKALAKGDSSLAAASMILGARMWQDLVDEFGNVPYSQAFTDSISKPKYDKAEDIYANLQTVLDQAISYLGEVNHKTDFLSVRTLVKIGNREVKWDANTSITFIQQKWMKFANTLKLRLLIRQSEKGGANAGELAKVQLNGGVLGAGETVEVNPGFSNANNKQSPFYQNYGTLPNGNQASTNTKANAYFMSLIDTFRVKRFFKPINGADPNLAKSYVGTLYGLQAGNPSNAASSDMGPGIAGSSEQDQWIFPSFESMFLTAEAVARGWLPGDAKTAYEDAVKESFVWLGVPDAADIAVEYLTTPDASWDDNAVGGSVEDQASFIAFQKYLALAGIDQFEAWSDIRRLNMIPDGYQSNNEAAISQTIPIRLLYPQSEINTNPVNVTAQGDINQFNTKLFWQP